MQGGTMVIDRTLTSNGSAYLDQECTCESDEDALCLRTMTEENAFGGTSNGALSKNGVAHTLMGRHALEDRMDDISGSSNALGKEIRKNVHIRNREEILTRCSRSRS